MQANIFFKSSKAGFLLLLTFFVIQTSVHAQNFLEIPVKLEVEGGDMKDIVVKVKKEGKDAFTQSGESKMRFKLDYNKKYTLVFTKAGYITKTIEVNTTAPAARIAAGFEAYKIGVKLFKQSTDEKTVVYNQPVAKIKYDANLDEFNFETDYSKSILSAMNNPTEPTPKDNSAKNIVTPDNPKMEDEAIPPPPAVAAAPAEQKPAPVTTPATASTGTEQEPTSATPTTAMEPVAAEEKIQPVISQEEAPVAVAPAGDETPMPARKMQGGEEPQGAKRPSAGEESQKKSAPAAANEKPAPVIMAQSGEEINKPKIKANNGEEAPASPSIYLEEEKIVREDIVEKNRVITKVRVMKGRLTTEYSRVNYSWGGAYYFKNNSMSIPQNLFVQWTGVNN